MPNIFAYIMLIGWPFISIVLFSNLKLVPAFVITVIGGYLVLPANFSIDFALIPSIDKSSIISLSLVIGCILIKKVPVSFIPPNGIERKFVIALLILPIITTLSNQEPVFNGAFWTPGLSAHDTVSALINSYLYLIPLILGMQVLNTRSSQEELFKILTISALFYSVLILFEIRMSPQLHNLIYGFFPHDFVQQMRGDGFRAVVFLGHGLVVAIFIVISIGAISVLWKNNHKQIFGIPMIMVLLYFLLILIAQKSFGSLMLGLILFFSVLFLPAKMTAKLSLCLISIVIFYPLLSLLDLFPHEMLLDNIAAVDPQRADSLSFRFYHENQMLEHARQKFLFGWGGWGRGMLYGSVPDGKWILVLGSNGILGFICLFGLSFVSIFRGFKLLHNNKHNQSDKPIAIHMLIVAMILIDQIPNDSLNSLSLIIIACLLSCDKWLLNSNGTQREFYIQKQ